MSVFLTVEDIKNIAYEYARAHLTYDEPLPSFEMRYPDKLEIALHAPQQMVGGEVVYKTLPEQAAVLFYEMIKLHPFFNGNKRIACVSLLTFVMINGKWLRFAGWRDLYDFAVGVAESEVREREQVILELTITFHIAIVEESKAA